MTFVTLVEELERVIKIGPGEDTEGYLLTLGSVIGRYVAEQVEGEASRAHAELVDVIARETYESGVAETMTPAERVRAVCAMLTKAKRTIDFQIESFHDANVRAEAERDAAIARVATQAEALEEISGRLECEEPCSPFYVSCECGKKKERWCAGCVARAAIAKTSADETCGIKCLPPAPSS